MPTPIRRWEPWVKFDLPCKPRADRNFPCLHGQDTANTCSSTPTKADIAKLEKELDFIAGKDPDKVQFSDLEVAAERALCFRNRHRTEDNVADLQRQWWTKLQSHVASLSELQVAAPPPATVPHQRVRASESTTAGAESGTGTTPTAPAPERKYTRAKTIWPGVIQSRQDFGRVHMPDTGYPSPLVHFLEEPRQVLSASTDMRKFLDYEKFWQRTLIADCMCTATFYADAQGDSYMDWLRGSQMTGNGAAGDGIKENDSAHYYRFFLDMIVATAPVSQVQAGGSPTKAYKNAQQILSHAKSVVECEEERWGVWFDQWKEKASFTDLAECEQVVRSVRAGITMLKEALRPGLFLPGRAITAPSAHDEEEVLIDPEVESP